MDIEKPNSFKNRDLISEDTKCGCYHCLRIFHGRDIKQWIKERDGGQTAVCPFCMVDSVVVYSDEVTLTELRKRWFSY